MKIDRKKLLKKCELACSGVGKGKLLPESDRFLINERQLSSFNDEVSFTLPIELDISISVDALLFMDLLRKFNNQKLDMEVEDNKLTLKSKRAEGHIQYSEPSAEVPTPPEKGWKDITEGVMDYLVQAARVCGIDETQFLTTCVHVGPDLVEGCDNTRLYRAMIKTGFDEDFLLPAPNIKALPTCNYISYALSDSWFHLKMSDGGVVSVRYSKEKYLDGIDKVLELGPVEEVQFPPNFRSILQERAGWSGGTTGHEIQVSLSSSGQLRWDTKMNEASYSEKRRVKYQGTDLAFTISRDFLTDMLLKTKAVSVDKESMRIQMKTKNEICVVALQHHRE